MMKTMTAVKTIMTMMMTQIDEYNSADFRNSYILNMAFPRIQVYMCKERQMMN